MIDKIKKFTVDDKNNLLSKTFYVLPDNPSDKHFSPSQIRKKAYEGYLVLFEFLNSVIDAINENVDLSNEDIEAINANITNLVNVSDIIDNLTSEISNKPVSAKQAFILKGMIDTLTAIVNTKANSTDVYDKNEIDAKINDLILADIDTDFSLTSTNPIQNKVISKQIKDINYTIMTMKEELFETVLSEIDYKVDYATIYPIPETLSDDDGTHRVVYSDTQLKEIEGNSVAFNQLLMPYNSNLNADYYFCECEDMVLENCSYLKQTGDNYLTDYDDLNCQFGSFHAEAYLGYTAPYEASGRGFVHNFNVDEDVSSMTYTFNAPGGGKADLVLRGATNIVNTSNYSATALNVGTAVNIELNGVSINHLIKSTDNFVGKAPGQAEPQNRNKTHEGTGFSLNGRYLYLLWTNVVIKGVNLSVGKNTLKITAKNGLESGHWDSVKFDITPYKNGGSSVEEANKETINGITFTNNGDGSFSVSGTATADAIKVFLSRDWDINHSYLVRGLLDKGIDGSVYWYDNSNGQFSSSKDYIFKPTNTSNSQRKVALMIKNGTTVNFTFFPQVHDITQMNLDNITTVEEFNRIFPLTYYPHNTGEIKSTVIKGVKVNGYNLFDGIFERGDVDNSTGEETTDNKFIRSDNFIKVIAGQTYSLEQFDFAFYTIAQRKVVQFDENKNVIKSTTNFNDDGQFANPYTITLESNCRYVRIVYYNGATQIPLDLKCVFHSTGSRTDYAPYKEPHIIQIPQTELPSADLVHDTIKIVEGNVVAGQQRYNIVHVSKIDRVDLGTLNWYDHLAENKYYVDNFEAKGLPTDAQTALRFELKANIHCAKLLRGSMKDITIKSVAIPNTIAIRFNDTVSAYAPSYKNASEFKDAMSGVILNYEKKEYTETTLATDLTFEEVSAIIEQGGSIETIFEIVPPNLKTAFVVNKAIVS